MISLPRLKAMEASRSELIRHYDRYLDGLLDDGPAERYIRQVYDYLELMPPGTRLNLRAEGDKLKWLLVAVGAFLAAGDHWMDFQLNDDYTRLRRVCLPPDFRRRMQDGPATDSGI